MAFQFQLEATDPTSAARAGRFTTAHGEVLTPAVMPVGTAGSVKTLTPDELREMPAEDAAVLKAVDRTLAWAARGIAERERLRAAGSGGMALFGIVQGGVDANQRRRCFEGLSRHAFDGWALGGLWVGEGR